MALFDQLEAMVWEARLRHSAGVRHARTNAMVEYFMARTKSLPRRHSFVQALIDKKGVMGAVILRDMRTRFFNHGLGFALVPMWPLVHMLLLIGTHTLATHGAPPPYGTSTPVFFMTGTLPFLAFTYVSRFMGYSLIMNRPMLAFPIVKVNDILFARAFLESAAAFVTLFSITMILWIYGEDPFPFDLHTAVSAYLATLFLALGCGYLVGVLSMFFVMMPTAWALTIIVIYVSSGVWFVASNLPDQLSYWLSFNPVVVCIEWFRTAYYESYSNKLVDRTYVLSFGLGALFIGMILERFFRRQMLE